MKDRGAVPMAGRAGKAFWFSKTSGEFVISPSYCEHYPAWVDAWNRRKLPEAYRDKSWELLHNKSKYLFGNVDNLPRAG